MWQLVVRLTKMKMGIMMRKELCMIRNYTRTLLNLLAMYTH